MGDQKVLTNILNMTLKLSEAEEKPLGETVINEERKEFLQQAIRNTLDNDDSKKLLMYTKCFLTYDPSAIFSEKQMDDLEVLFEALNLLVEGFDISKDFNSMGGLVHCLYMLKSNPNNSIRWRAADLIANCLHNNPKCQESILEKNGMEIILENLENKDEEILVIKCLYALSTLLGGYPDSLKLFSQLEGPDFFLRMFKVSVTKVKIKTAFLLLKIAFSEEINIDRYINKDLITKLIVLLEEEIDPSHIHILRTLVIFIKKKRDSLLSKAERSKLTVSFKGYQQNLKKDDAECYEDEIEEYSFLIDLLK